ncbi:hypothetical protein [Natrinema marinum]|uniref:hypothetical protein n=1 Tax=Natrinema marinum TaxID=2961598 RepID=UPI0020C832DF|nr:hypothetical protein [Natrinema marinum]
MVGRNSRRLAVEVDEAGDNLGFPVFHLEMDPEIVAVAVRFCAKRAAMGVRHSTSHHVFVSSFIDVIVSIIQYMDISSGLNAWMASGDEPAGTFVT